MLRLKYFWARKWLIPIFLAISYCIVYVIAKANTQMGTFDITRSPGRRESDWQPGTNEQGFGWISMDTGFCALFRKDTLAISQRPLAGNKISGYTFNLELNKSFDVAGNILGLYPCYQQYIYIEGTSLAIMTHNGVIGPKHDLSAERKDIIAISQIQMANGFLYAVCMLNGQYDRLLTIQLKISELRIIETGTYHIYEAPDNWIFVGKMSYENSNPVFLAINETDSQISFACIKYGAKVEIIPVEENALLYINENEQISILEEVGQQLKFMDLYCIGMLSSISEQQVIIPSYSGISRKLGDIALFIYEYDTNKGSYNKFNNYFKVPLYSLTPQWAEKAAEYIR